MSKIRTLLLATASAVGLVVAAAGPAAAGMSINHSEPVGNR